MNKDKLEKIKILQSEGLIYTPFIPHEQDSIRENSYNELPFTIEDSEFPIEPVKIVNPITQESEEMDNSAIDRDVITEKSSDNGKIYKSYEKEIFKSDLYKAYLKELSSRNIKNAEEFAKRLTTQDILESNWGQSSLSKAFNFGGIKDFSGNGIIKDTIEVIDGKKIKIKQSFRKFTNIDEYVNYKINLVDRKWKVFRSNPEEYYSLIVSGKQKYATDPNYVLKMNNLYKQVWRN